MIEGSPIDASELLRCGVDPEVVEVVTLMTSAKDVPDEVYYARIAAHQVAREVGLADIADDNSPVRVSQLDPATRDRLTVKYVKALRALNGV